MSSPSVCAFGRGPPAAARMPPRIAGRLAHMRGNDPAPHGPSRHAAWPYHAGFGLGRLAWTSNPTSSVCMSFAFLACGGAWSTRQRSGGAQ